MMNCDRYHNLLMEYLDHELEGFEAESLDRHLLSCPQCRALRDDLAGILGTLEKIPSVEPGPELEGLVMDRIMSLPARPDGVWKTSRKVVYGTLAGMAALLFLMLGLSARHAGYPDLLAACRDYVQWSSTILVALQAAYQVASALLPEDVSAALLEIQVVLFLAVLVLAIVGVKAAFARLTEEHPRMP